VALAKEAISAALYFSKKAYKLEMASKRGVNLPFDSSSAKVMITDPMSDSALT